MSKKPLPIKISKELLVWARKDCRKSIEEIARNIGVNPEKIIEWESGRTQPTYNQLENLAYKAYKRPIAFFFRKTPPTEVSFEKDFRSIQPQVLQNLSSDFFLSIRQVKYIQSKIEDIIGGDFYQKFLDFNPKQDVKISAIEFRKFIGFNLDIQKSWNPKESLNRFKIIVEDLGIFIFQLDFPISDARGFSLYGKYPIIVINKNDSANGRIFTIFHELFHILIKSGNIFSDGSLADSVSNIEYKCNSFAAEFLVPESDFLKYLKNIRSVDYHDDESLEFLAKIYKVSKEVILRKLIDLNLVSWDLYFIKKSIWEKEWQASKDESRKKIEEKKKDFRISQAQKAIWERGKPLIKKLIASYERGDIPLSSIPEYLGVKVEHLNKIIEKAY